MFVFFSLLAASIDGFVRGFVIGSIGIKIRFKETVTIFMIIFLFCCTASLTGKLLTYTLLEIYLNLIGVTVMAALSWSAFKSHNTYRQSDYNLAAVSVSVAADAGVACLYLAIYGHNPLYISFVSAVLHTLLMYAAAAMSSIMIKDSWVKCSRYISGFYFLIMAIYKLVAQ